jgi:hypothetical protein
MGISIVYHKYLINSQCACTESVESVVFKSVRGI